MFQRKSSVKPPAAWLEDLKGKRKRHDTAPETGIRLLVGRKVYDRSGTADDGAPIFRFVHEEPTHG